MLKQLLRFDKYFRKVEFALAIFAGVIAFLLMILITVDVFLRNVLNSALPGSYELVMLSFIAVVFLAIPYVQSIKGHINIDIATKSLPESARKILDFIACVLAFIIIIFITWQTGLEAWKSFVSQDYTMGIVHFPLWPSKFSIVLGMILLSIRLCLDALFHLFNIEDENEEDATSENL